MKDRRVAEVFGVSLVGPPQPHTIELRGVAQPGSAPEWGSGGRRFKSSRPD